MRRIIHIGLLTSLLFKAQFSICQEPAFVTYNVIRSSRDIPEMATLLSRYIQVESESGNEGNAGRFLSNYCESKGLYVRRFTTTNNSYNFAASLYPLDLRKPNIILLNHIDVVSHDHADDWTYPPYSGMIKNGMVWGRGTIDNKGMAIMQLEALMQFIELSKTEDLPYNVTLLSVSAEEVGGELGAKLVSENYLDELNPLVVLGEGGSGVSGLINSDTSKVVYGVSVASKRGLWLRLKLNMHTSGHGAIPPKEYVNKVMIAALARLNEKKQHVQLTNSTKQMFQEMGAMENGFRSMALRNIGFLKPLLSPVLRNIDLISSLVTNTITLTNMSNPPASVNVISQNAEAVLDCRLLPHTNTESFIQEIEKALDDDRIMIEVINETTKADESDIGLYFNEISRSIKAVNPEAGVIPILFPAFNDNNFFRAKGVPVYGILPVHLDMDLLEGIHNVDERISIRSMEKGKAVYQDFLLRMMTMGMESEPISQNSMTNP